MATRKPNIGKLDTEITALTTQRRALKALEDAAILNDFMISICEDPSKAEAYKKNPEAFVKNAGLPEHLIDLVLSSSRYAFRAAAGGGLLADGGETVVVVVIIVVVVIL
jgi:hypothetical protein